MIGDSSLRAPHRPLLIVALSVVVTVSYGALFYGFSVLIADEAAGAVFSTAVLSASYGGAVLTSGIAAVPVGRIADRSGIRPIVAAGSVLGAVGLVAFSSADEAWQVLATWWLAIGPAMAMTLYDPAYVAIQQWFEPDDRPRAIAVLTLAAGLSGPIFTPATAALVDAVDWRDAARLLATLFAVAGAGAALLAIPPGVGPSMTPETDARLPLSERIRAFGSVRLLTFTLGAVLAYGALEANIIHRVARFEENGFDVPRIASWAALSGLLTLPGRFILPVLGSRWPGTNVLASVFIIMALATAFMVPGDETWLMATYFCLFGLVFGAALPLRAVVMSGWYGVAGFGTIMGVQSAAISVSRSTGPVLIGTLRDATGEYGVAMVVLTLLFALGACLVVVSGRSRGNGRVQTG